MSHNGFELDKYFKTDDLKKCSRFWIILFKTILSKLYHWKIYVVGSVEYQYPNHLFQAGYFLDKKYYDENTIDFKHLLLSEKNQSLLKDIQNSNTCHRCWILLYSNSHKQHWVYPNEFVPS